MKRFHSRTHKRFNCRLNSVASNGENLEYSTTYQASIRNILTRNLTLKTKLYLEYKKTYWTWKHSSIYLFKGLIPTLPTTLVKVVLDYYDDWKLESERQYMGQRGIWNQDNWLYQIPAQLDDKDSFIYKSISESAKSPALEVLEEEEDPHQSGT